MLRFFARTVASVNIALKDLQIPGVTIVRTREQAQAAVAILNSHRDRVHAWDTETIGINPKEESPVGRGYVICASAFIGPEVDFGSGPSNL